VQLVKSMCLTIVPIVAYVVQFFQEN
jgi:hypothetical protein